MARLKEQPCKKEASFALHDVKDLTFGNTAGESPIPGEKRKHRRIVIGSVDTLRDESSALKAITALRREINRNDARLKAKPLTLAELVEHYRQRELTTDNEWKTLSTEKLPTKATCENGSYHDGEQANISAIRAVEVEIVASHPPTCQGQSRQDSKSDECPL